MNKMEWTGGAEEREESANVLILNDKSGESPRFCHLKRK